MRGYPPPDKLLEQIREKNLTSFAAAKTELKLLPITEVENTRKFISENHSHGNYTFINFPWVNHGSKVLLRDTPERRQMRQWLQDVLNGAPTEARAYDDARMRWWREARFGMFVHWGLFSSAGGKELNGLMFKDGGEADLYIDDITLDPCNPIRTAQ
jgi:hypothetical protein